MKNLFSSLTAASALTMVTLGLAASPAMADACTQCGASLPASYSNPACPPIAHGEFGVSAQFYNTTHKPACDSSLTPILSNALQVCDAWAKDYGIKTNCVSRMSSQGPVCSGSPEVGSVIYTAYCGYNPAL